MWQEAGNVPYIDVCSGDLHRRVGDYPNPSRHRMPVCCEVMRRMMKAGDEERPHPKSPPSGAGANVIIRYMVPRNKD